MSDYFTPEFQIINTRVYAIQTETTPIVMSYHLLNCLYQIILSANSDNRPIKRQSPEKLSNIVHSFSFFLKNFHPYLSGYNNERDNLIYQEAEEAFYNLDSDKLKAMQDDLSKKYLFRDPPAQSSTISEMISIEHELIDFQREARNNFVIITQLLFDFILLGDHAEENTSLINQIKEVRDSLTTIIDSFDY